MNLTVAKKIIGGFAILIVLLCITSSISFFNLQTIDQSITKQNKLATPTLQGSNNLANNLMEMGSISLQAYYQKSISKLDELKSSYSEINADYRKTKTQLTNIVKGEALLTNNLNKANAIYNSLTQDIETVFSSRKSSIELTSKISDLFDTIEEKADDTATLMLDLADHRLAETKLAEAVTIGESIESTLNGAVSTLVEYSDSIEPQSVSLLENDLTNFLSNINEKVKAIDKPLQKNNVTDISEDLNSAMNDLDDLLNKMFKLKASQLDANKTAEDKLLAAKKDIAAANKILTTQIELANKTANDVATLVNNKVSSGIIQISAILVISIIVAFIVGVMTLKSITTPLGKVNDILRIVASGDLTKRLDERGKDEFALLAKNCNQVIDSLRTLIEGIISRSTQLAAAAEETSAVTAQSTSAIEEQRNQVEQAASATTEMSSTSKSVLSSAHDALSEIKQADDEATRVKKISKNNKVIIQSLAQEVESAAEVIHQLQQDSSSIGGILDVIRGIAEQTNLLALNAAIEAARAGEQGRGFAVVADEVRTLASRTQESTQEIQKMIEALQTGAEKAVSVMDTGRSQAGDCVEQTELANQALDTITDAVHKAYDRSSQIATAAEEQSIVAHEISENLESIVAIAEQTSAGSKQTAASSSEVAKLSEELQQSVQEFKV